MQRKFIGPILVLMIASFGYAQTKPAPAPDKPAPTLTEAETLKIENAQLKFQVLEDQIQTAKANQASVRAQYKAVTDAIEQEHPGYSVNFPTGSTPVLVKKPEPPKTEAPKTAEPKPAVK